MQAELIGLFPSQLNHRQASICMLLRCSTVGTLQSQVFMSRRVGENFWRSRAVGAGKLWLAIWNLHVPWPMAAGIGEAFSKPFLASVFASRPSCLYLNRRQKVYPKLKPFLASDFSLLGWFLGTNIFVETLYSVFACTYKQAELIGLFPSQLNHRQASICMLLRCSKNTGGVLELVHNFGDVLRSWLWRRNPVQWLWSYECIGCRHLLFWEFVLRGLRN